MTIAVLNTTTGEVENKPLDHARFTTPEFNWLTAENFAAKLAQANLVSKTDFGDKLITLVLNKLPQIKPNF